MSIGTLIYGTIYQEKQHHCIVPKLGCHFWMFPCTAINAIAESICTHYSNLSGRPDILLGSGTFKISGTLLFAKSRVQKTGSFLFKKRRDQAAPSLFELQ